MIDTLPRKIHYAYWFQAFNAASWQICLGSPLILFARHLGAPSVILGILAGISPLTLVLQLLVARYAEQIGYRTLMLRGWTVRVAVLSVLVVLPLAAPVIGTMTALYMMIAVMAVFAVSKAVGICAWMPWVAAIVPKPMRGYYLSRDRTFISISTLLTLAGSGILLWGSTQEGYAVVFLVGFLAGVVSLFFLRRIPEPQVVLPASDTAHAAGAVNWRNLLRDKAFVRLILFGVAVQVVVSGSSTFSLIFVREKIGIGDGSILWLSAGASLVGLAALQLLRHRADRIGSKPILTFVLCWWGIYYLLWFLLSIDVIPGRVMAVVLIMVAAGFFAAMYDLGVTRLLLNLAGDRPASPQYFALYSVLVSAVAGLGPIVWGSILDLLRTTNSSVLGYALNEYSYLFGIQFVLLAGITLMLIRLREPTAQSFRQVVYEAFVETPTQVVRQLVPAIVRRFGRER